MMRCKWVLPTVNCVNICKGNEDLVRIMQQVKIDKPDIVCPVYQFGPLAYLKPVPH